MSSRRSLIIEPTRVQEILQSNGQTSPKPSPHESTPASPAGSAGSSGRTSFQSHGRTMSVMTDATSTAAPRSNRFSLHRMSFPIATSGTASPIRTSQSPERETFSTLPEGAAIPAAPTDTNFLTAIAAQERRVLELKEELMRAEAGLHKLKEQWAQHEAQKKRNDARSLTKLQPLHTSLANTDTDNADDSDGSSAWMQQEMERRKALMSGSKSSNRTVFEGGRHTRTLSLLSPTGRNGVMQPPPRPERPPRKDSLPAGVRRSQEMDVRPKALARAATTSNISVDGTQVIQSPSEFADAGIDRDLLLQTGKKVATGLRDGLWTFLEDLRQATVGEDSAPIAPPRRQSSNQTLRGARKKSSKASLRPSSRGSDTSKTPADTNRPGPGRRKSKSKTMSMSNAPALADPSFWTEHGILPPARSTATAKKSPASSKHAKSASKTFSTTSTDSWDTWGEESPQVSRSSIASNDSDAPTVSSTPRTSAESTTNADTIKAAPSSGKKDPIPWPALSNLGPKALRRTASHLMSEWERSLTPSPGKESRGGEDYLGLGAEAAAVGGAN